MELEITKSQRKKIYIQLANEFFVTQDFGVCCSISDIIWHKYKKLIISQDVTEYFVEFGLFKPDDCGFFWWDDKDYLSRVNALLLCAEMCNDKTN